MTPASLAAEATARDAGAHVPPGYRPGSLIPSGYNPPWLKVLSPEYQLEVYKKMEVDFVGQTAKRGATTAPLPAAPAPITPRIAWRGQAFTDVGAFMEAARFSGVLVIDHGEVVLEQYGLGRSADDRWTSFSVAKSVTSLLVGAALQDGHIQSLEEPVTKYIPELVGSAYEGVSIRQLLTMTSGVKWNEDYADLNSDVMRATIWPGQPGINPLVDYMKRLPRAAEPGTVFSYKTGETDMAGVLVANATGRGLAQYLSEKIWAPYGMERDAFWVVDTGSVERGGCCLSMTLRDYGRLGLFVLGGGVAGGKRVIAEDYLRDAVQNQVRAPATGSYGYFWWVDGSDAFSARGIFGQSIQIVPSEALVVVTNGAFRTAMDPAGIEAMTSLLDGVRAALKD
ncbi:MAG: serine hydrolase domain-containing protein [Polyangiales bacterium]